MKHPQYTFIFLFLLLISSRAFAEPVTSKDWFEMSEKERTVLILNAMKRGINVGRLFSSAGQVQKETASSRDVFRERLKKEYFIVDRQSSEGNDEI